MNLTSQYNSIHAEQGINEGGMSGELSLEECQRNYIGGNVQGECPRVLRDNRVGLL